MPKSTTDPAASSDPPLSESDDDTSADSTSQEPDGPQVSRELVCGLVTLAIVAVFLGNSGPEGIDWLFPKVLSYALAALAVILVMRGLLGFGDKMPLVPVVLRGQGVDVAVFSVFTVAYVALVPYVGFWAVTAAMIVAAAVYLDTRPSIRGAAISVAVSLILCVVAYVVLTKVFYIDFPPAPWGWW